MNYLKSFNRGKVGAWQLLQRYLIENEKDHKFTRIDVVGIRDEFDANFDDTIYSYLQVLLNAGVLEKVDKRFFIIKNKLKPSITISYLRRLMRNNQSLDEIFE